MSNNNDEIDLTSLVTHLPRQRQNSKASLASDEELCVLKWSEQQCVLTFLPCGNLIFLHLNVLLDLKCM